MTRTRHARRALLAGLATLSLGLAACGDDDAGSGDVTVVDDTASDDTSTDDTATESTATEGTTTESRATEGTGGGDVDLDAYSAAAAEQLEFQDADVAECVARGIIEPIGADEIAATGLSPEEFIGSESIAATGITIDDDLRASMEAQIAECGGLVEELVASQFSGDPDVAACVTAELDDAVVANVLVTGLTDGEPSQAALDAQAKTRECEPDSATTESPTTES